MAEKQNRGYKKSDQNDNNHGRQNQNNNSGNNDNTKNNDYKSRDNNRQRGYNNNNKNYNKKGYKQGRQYNKRQNAEPLVNPLVPIYSSIARIDANQLSAFFVAEIVSIEEYNYEAKDGQKSTYKLVTLKDIQATNPTVVAEIKLYPGNASFVNDIVEKKKIENYKTFSSLKSGQSVRILNGQFIKTIKYKPVEGEENQAVQQTPTYNQIKIIRLNEWSQVQLVEQYQQNEIGKITANNKFVNILALITHVEELKETSNQRALSLPASQDPAETKAYKITLRDASGEIFCIIPKLGKFDNFISVGKYLYFERAQILFSINNDERQIYLSIFIDPEGKKKQKGFIIDLTETAEYKQTIEEVKAKTGLTNISNKIWIVKQN